MISTIILVFRFYNQLIYHQEFKFYSRFQPNSEHGGKLAMHRHFVVGHFGKAVIPMIQPSY